MQLIEKNREKIAVFGFCFFISFIILMLTSKCSFLYPMNDWVDANAFFTVGKGMFRGIVPYLDVFEQKGPFLYFIYGIGSLFSHTTFLGVFFLEVLFWAFALYYVYKIINLFVHKNWAYVLIPLFTVLLCVDQSFVHGGSAEEFCLPFLFFTLYSFLKYFQNKEISNRSLFLMGLCAGFVLLIKFNILGFWFMVMATLFFNLLIDKKYKKAFLSCFVFLGGMALPFLIFLIYFAICGGVKEFIHVYFVVNMTNYASTSSLWERLSFIFGNYEAMLLSKNLFIFFAVYLFPILVFLLKWDMRGKVSLILAYIGTILGIFWGMVAIPYYIFPCLVFGLFSFIALSSLLERYFTNKVLFYLSICSTVTSIVLAYFFANYASFRLVSKNDLIQYEYAEILKEYDHPTLVNMGFLDMGLYTTANLVPSTYYFEFQNLDYDKYPYNMDSFQEYIKNKTTMFILYSTVYSIEELQKEEPLLFENYELLAKRGYLFEDDESLSKRGYLFEKLDRNAYLFKRKENEKE